MPLSANLSLSHYDLTSTQIEVTSITQQKKMCIFQKATAQLGQPFFHVFSEMSFTINLENILRKGRGNILKCKFTRNRIKILLFQHDLLKIILYGFHFTLSNSSSNYCPTIPHLKVIFLKPNAIRVLYPSNEAFTIVYKLLFFPRTPIKPHPTAVNSFTL